MGWLAAAGQQLRELLSLPRPLDFDEPPAAEFDTAPQPIAQLLAEMAAASPGRVSRAEALSVTAVKRGRNSLCSIATLPLVQYKGLDIVRSTWLEQIDPDVANVVTLAQTIEDLALEAISWWQITAQDFAGFPLAARHLDVNTVSLDPPDGQPNPFPSGVDARGVKIVWVAGKATPADRLIRFDSPNPGLLSSDAQVIRRALLLNRLASTYADNPRPTDYFTDSDDPSVEPMADDEIDPFLAEWQAKRKRRSTAWIPSSVKRVDVNTPSPAEIQLVELQRQVTLEIANGLGVDPEDLGVSTTSRTYFNAQDRRTSKINETYAPYMTAITQRLSMGDVTRSGHRVAFDLTDYLKPDPAGQAAYWKSLKDMGAMGADEIRAAAGLSGPAPKQAGAAPETAGSVEAGTSGARALAEIIQKVYLGVDTVVTNEEARMILNRAGAGLPSGPLPVAEPEPKPAPPDPAGDGQQPTDQAQQVAAAGDRAEVTFDGGPSTLTLDAEVVGFSVDTERRTIEGLVLPYGKTASKYGVSFRFEQGALRWQDPARVKLLRDHDYRQPLGKAVSLSESRAGLRAKFTVAPGPAGDEALALADHGTLDGLSVGVDFDMATDTVPDKNDKGAVLVRRADLRETSLTAVPAFDDARVSKVAASRDRLEPGMPEQENEPNEAQTTPPAAGGVNLNQDQMTALLRRPGAIQALVQTQQPQQPDRPAAPEGALTLSAEQVDSLIRGGQLGALLGVPLTSPARQEAEPERRQTVDPTRRTTVTASVDEGQPYRFDQKGNLTKGAHDFSTDLIAGFQGDGEALERAQNFMRNQFDKQMRAEFVNQADAATLNPSQQRPDLYVDQKDFEYPLWNVVNKGTINDATPFVLPKFNTSAGLVAGHTENTEPTPGTFTATAQTITPSAVSGKVEISREAWDQGGNPQLSGLVWRQMTRAWFEALEASAVALLQAAAPTTLTLTAGAVDAALEASLTDQLSPLQFVRGGFRMRDFFIQVDLYKKLIAAKDSNGRKLFPVLGAQNATGTTQDFFSAVLVAGLVGRPAWALAASSANAENSYLFDRGDVSGWATAPQRLTFENISVAKIHVGIWGYKALAITDLTGVRRITYDSVTP